MDLSTKCLIHIPFHVYAIVNGIVKNIWFIVPHHNIFKEHCLIFKIVCVTIKIILITIQDTTELQ